MYICILGTSDRSQRLIPFVNFGRVAAFDRPATSCGPWNHPVAALDKPPSSWFCLLKRSRRFLGFVETRLARFTWSRLFARVRSFIAQIRVQRGTIQFRRAITATTTESSAMIFASEPIGPLFSFSFQRLLGPLRAACSPHLSSAISFLSNVLSIGLSKFETGVSRVIRGAIKRAGISESEEGSQIEEWKRVIRSIGICLYSRVYKIV